METCTQLGLSLLLLSSSPLAQCEPLELAAGVSGPHDTLGFSTAVRGELAVLGAPGDTSGTAQIGFALVFAHDDKGTVGTGDDEWRELARLEPSDGAPSDDFGFDVGINQEFIVVGARDVDDACPANPLCNSGAVYVFVRDTAGTPQLFDDSWTEIQKLTASDAIFDGNFGHSLSLQDEHLLVGNRAAVNPVPGSAYVFARDDAGTPGLPADDSWIEIHKLEADDAESGRLFGASVALSASGTVLIGDPNDDSAAGNAGSAYVFEQDDAGTPAMPWDDSWVWTKKLYSLDPDIGDLFGGAVALSGDLALISARSDSEGGANAGAAYVFVRVDDGLPGVPFDDDWLQVDKLIAHDSAPFDDFGQDIAPAGDFVVVGAVGDDTLGTDAGAAYVFERDDKGTPETPLDDTWPERAKLLPAGLTPGERMGRGIAATTSVPLGATVLIGAPGPGDIPAGSAFPGRAFSYDLPLSAFGLTLDATPGAISVALGGAQELSVQTLCTTPALLYLLLGSISGSDPGFGLGGLQVPLNADAYFNHTVLHPNSAPLSQSLGFVFAGVPASAFFSIPAGSPGLVGITVHHVALGFDVAKGAFTHVSDPVGLLLVP